MDAQSLKAQIDSGVDQLKNNLSSLLRIDDGLQKRILQLEHDLNVHQLALAGLKVEHARLLKLEESVQGFRVVVLIDGDGTIFTHDLVAQGREGGDKAARLLSETITRFLDDTYGRNPYQVGVYIFCNKRGLSNVLGVADNIFDEFIVGLQQASPRFLVSDVGGGKEMADAKIKAQLQDNITLPQTFKIIFGGCHDSGYISELRAHITAGYRDKLILLKGCSMAKEIAALDLPAFGNPELFRTQKIVSIPLSRNEMLGRLTSLSESTNARNSFLESRVAELEGELSRSRSMFNELLVQATQQQETHQQQLVVLKQQLDEHDKALFKNPVIICVINGDEYIFPHFARGFAGGAEAATGLVKHVADYLKQDPCAEAFKSIAFCVTVYYSRRRLLEVLLHRSVCTVQQFDEFLTGFSTQHCSFTFVDVGGFDESHTDWKIQGIIKTFIHCAQTFRLFLGGRAQGSGYSSAIASLTKAELGKLVFVDAPNITCERPAMFPRLVVDQGFFVTAQTLVGTCGLLTPPSPQSVDARVATREIDPAIPLHKHVPPPCNEFYLMTCSKDAEQCKYSHAYVLTPAQLETLAANAKKAPCNWVKNGRPCPHVNCCWGHVCPGGSTCFHREKGRCWFKHGSLDCMAHYSFSVFTESMHPNPAENT
ncbi:hypothetical protein MKEN_00070800 [Mycena kentingensis (nom. inval.)]|nr:hypothetical protein MKEN_00070800 [Mycena kentingensis (nom. inval.)]